jgi:hypothetical protein
MSQETIATGDTISTALITKANDNFTELYLTKTEVENARDGEANLNARLDGIDTQLETIAAGSGVIVTNNDTTVGNLENKLVSADGTVTFSVTNPGGNEKLDFSITDATDMDNWQQKGAIANQSPMWDSDQGKWVPGTSTGVNLVASGTLPNGNVVSLNSDGTVSVTEGWDTSIGTAVVFGSAIRNYISATFDSSQNRVVIAYRDDDNSNYGTAIVGEVNGADNSISFGTAVVFESAETEYISATFDSSQNRVVIAYQDADNSNYGTAIVSQVEFTNIADWLGISSAAYTDEDTANIFKLGEVADNQTGLTTGTVYYVDSDGSLTTDDTDGYKIGRALSATELLITEGNA